MNRRLIILSSQTNHRVWLFKTVFSNRAAVFVVGLLFFSFLIQPFHQALANEVEVANDPTTAIPDEVIKQLPDAPDSEPVSEPQSTEMDTENADTETGSLADESENVSDGFSKTTVVESNNAEVDESTNDEESESTNSSDEAVDEVVESETVETTSTTTDEQAEQIEVDITSGTSTPEVTATSTTEAIDDTASSTENTIVSTSTEVSTGGSDDSDGQINTGTTTSTEISSSTASTTDSNTNDDGSTVDTPDDNVDNDNPDTNDDTNESQDGTDDSQASSTDDLIDSERIQGGVNDLVNGVVDEVVNLTRQLVTEENYYQFSRQSCVPVGDGTFHCSTAADVVSNLDSAIFSEQDNDGDMEIYLRTGNGDVKQITDNDYDDTSPDIHFPTMQAVWQRLVDGRYQIISYDIETRTETQLTFARNNSMEPKISAEGIVWQAWDGSDWEVMFFDGKFTDQITSNDSQDVTPVIEEGYILWSVLGGEKVEAKVYSLEGKEMMTISGYEGGSVANPRFVLVYDTQFDNGDVITQGFDPQTGLAKTLASKPVDLPFDIPEPDPVGEIRALIQNKSIHDENEVVAVSETSADDDLNLAPTTATSSSTLTVDIQPELNEVENHTEFDLELNDFDLVITDSASSTISNINNEILNQSFPISTSTVIATSTES